jgi:NAD(P)-dependent dehydrogenase (short-subunit alcohol dehydrogenase family)|tara:strand:+ start:1080 stop:1997 length:918 start_codon:yes stop_codon:yes gene_type:complete
MIRFDDRVAIVTGAGVGLGRSHALGLAARGAKVVVNDLGVGQDGTGKSSDAAHAVVAEIEAMNGEAFVHGADVSNIDQVSDMVAQTMKSWGRIDILVNNAGILLDKSFAKIPLADFRKVVDVHLMGSTNCCHAVWPIMGEQKFGRIVLTSSASGLYGNFGQSNYGAAKAAMVGLMNVLHHEGVRNNIRINTLAPTAATRMTENLLPPEALDLLAPETITPGLLYLVSEDGPSKTILSAGAGCFAQARIYETQGTIITGDITPEAVAQNWDKITDPTDQEELQDAFSQTRKYAKRAADAHKIKLDW